MSQKASHYKIGLFVIGSAAILVIGVIALGAAAAFRQTQTMVTYLDESVQGLAVGAPVKINGVAIGKVAKIELARDKYGLYPDLVGRDTWLRYGQYVVVTMELHDDGIVGAVRERGIEEAQQIAAYLEKNGYRVQLTSSGLTGPPYIEIVMNEEGQVDISEIPWREEHDAYLYLPATDSTMKQVSDSIEEVVADLEHADLSAMADSIRELLDDQLIPMVRTVNDGLAGFPELMQRLEVITINADRLIDRLNEAATDQLPGILDGLEGGARQMPQLVQRVDAVALHVDEAVGVMEQMMRDQVSPAITDLRRLADSLDRLANEQLAPALESVNSVTADLPDLVADFNSSVRRLDFSISTGQANLDEVLENLRRISADLTRISDNASRYPSHTLFGDPPPRSLGRDD